MHSIGERLKEERKRLGLSQMELCELTGITRKTLFSYETGERSPNVLFLSALFDHDFDVDYILKGELDRLRPSLLKKIQDAAESAFQMVNSTDIAVTPAQFAQMLTSLLATAETDKNEQENAVQTDHFEKALQKKPGER